MESKIIKALALFALGIFVIAGDPVDVVYSEGHTVRVAILNDVEDFVMSVRGKYQVVNLKTDQVLTEGKNLSKAKVTFTEKGIWVGEENFPVTRLGIIPRRDSTVTIDKRSFRGKIDVISSVERKMSVINTVDLENYVQGVIYHEISHRWPLEVLKAQAVATRTYALFRIATNTGKEFDVTSDIYSQVYGGKSAERYRTNLAVKLTRGTVMTYRGKILPAYFHAACGGYTEDAVELWDKSDIFPLKGVPCHYCFNSPHYNWKRNFRLKDIQDQLNNHGYKLGLIKDISILERNPGGRIRKLRITTRDGKEATISGKDFRNIIGPNDVRSNNFKIEMKGYYLDLAGHGWGHGVGMCQWGAYEMARQHKTYEEILDYYYPGLDIVDESKIKH